VRSYLFAPSEKSGSGISMKLGKQDRIVPVLSVSHQRKIMDPKSTFAQLAKVNAA
jgi:hypothetical protein